MNKFCHYLVSILLLSIACFQLHAQSISASKYYRHLMFRESPFASYQGVHPITSQQAQQVAHYKFDYDKQGRVVAIAHQIGDEIISNNGNWDTFIWFSPKLTVEYNDDGEIHRYFNADNEQIHAHGNVFTAKYQYDDKGMRKSLRFYDSTEEPSENAWQIHHYTWSVDKQKRIVEKRFSLAKQLVSIRPEFKFYETRMQYAHNGQLEFIYNYGTEGKPTNNESGAGIDRIYYDHHGNFQRWQVFSKDFQPVAGNRPMVHVGEHLYDELGNKVGLRGFNVKGEQMNFSWGSYEMKYRYDAYGNQIFNQSIDEQGNQLSASVIEYSTDGLNRQLYKILDKNGKATASPHLNGGAAIKFEYAKNSKKVKKRIFLDQSMQVMTQ